MTDDSTPQGTVEQSAPPVAEDNSDALLDKLFGTDDAPEQEQDAPEASAEGAGTDLPAEESEGQEDDAKQERPQQSRDELGRFVSDEAKVQLPDGSVTTIAELKRGSLREADYTRKTQETAALRRELEQRQAEITQKSQAYEAKIAEALSVLESYSLREPDISLISENPVAYWQQKAVYDKLQAERQRLEAAKQQSEQERITQHQQAFQQYYAEQFNLLQQKVPELKDPVARQAFGAEIMKAAAKYGFTDQELGQVHDHRMMLVLRDVAAYQRLQAGKPKAMAKTDGKPPLTPGRRQNPASEKQRSRQADWDRLRQSSGRDTGALDRILDDLI